MKSYQSHKIVKAVKCGKIEKSPSSAEGTDFRLTGDDGQTYEVNEKFFARGEPTGAFYIVEYEDGYRSFSPAEAFENGYTEICDVERDLLLQTPPIVEGNTFNFGDAIRALKDGKKVVRIGWHGTAAFGLKGQFIYYVPANSYPASGNTLGTMKGVFPDDMVPYQAYIAMKTTSNTVVPWLASQSDVLADDWFVLDEQKEVKVA